jgi:hypothetical protein
MDDMENASLLIYKYVFFGLMAFFGGIVHSLVTYRRGEIRNRWDFVALSVISGFCGMMWSLLTLIYFPENVFVIAFASGMGGYLSVEGLALIVIYFKNKFIH